MNKDHISAVEFTPWNASIWLQGVYHEEHHVWMLQEDEQDDPRKHSISNSKDRWINIVRILIQRERVRSMSNWCQSDSLCYLAYSNETTKKVVYRSNFELTKHTPYGQAMGWLYEYLLEINCSRTWWEMALLIWSGCLQLSTLTASSFPRQMIMVGQGLPMYHSWLTLCQHTDHCGVISVFI